MDLFTSDNIRIIGAIFTSLLPFLVLYEIRVGNDERLIYEARVLGYEKKRNKRGRKKATQLDGWDRASALFVFFVYRLFLLTNTIWVIAKAIIFLPGYLLFLVFRVRVMIGFRFGSGLLKRISAYSYGKIVDRTAGLLREGVEIYASFGELGYLMFENEKIHKSLRYAHRKNNAKIFLSHGPLVDPKSKKIFKLAQSGVMKIRASKDYYHNHFILVKTKSGKHHVIDEQIHDEAIWDSREKEPVYDNKSRLIFFYTDRQDLWNKKIEVFRKRYSSQSKLVKQNPGLRKTQRISVRKTLKEFFWYNIFLGNFLQPISILAGFPINWLYK